MDIEGLLRDALESALEDQGLQRSDNPESDLYTLSAQIVNYEKGSAFKRWVLPEYGSTILSVNFELSDTQDGSFVGSIPVRRTVRAGGVFTIGAWRTIFRNVADDVAKALAKAMKSTDGSSER